MSGQKEMSMRTTCTELLERPGPHSPSKPEIDNLWLCCAPAEPAARLACPAGRRDATAGPYCTEHGGHTRADAEARRDWSFLAPASVGNDFAVQEAGCLGLTSLNAYLIIREEARGKRPAIWRVRSTVEARRAFEAAETAVTGMAPVLQHWTLGSASRECTSELEARWRAVRASRWIRGEQVAGLYALRCYMDGERPIDFFDEPLVAGITIEHLPARDGANIWTAAIGVGSFTRTVGQFESPELAERIGRVEWRERLERDVAGITAARGGTLDWGMPVEPRAEPIILRPVTGESAWDAVART